MKVSKYKIKDNLYRCECGKEFEKFQSMNAHFRHCKLHRDTIGGEFHPNNHKGKMCGWDNKTEEEKQEIYNKRTKTLIEKYKSGKLKSYWLGKHHTEESKEKTRISTLKYIESLPNYKGTKARYSHKACEYINQINKEKNWNLQHAENGGEYSICGYFVDGYDKDLNIVFEYDEPYHYIDKENNILNNKDIKRQQNIINKLYCEFWRYNEYLDLLYKVQI